MIVDVQLILNECDRYFLQNFQCITILISAFCKIWEHKIVFVYFLGSFSGSQLLQNMKIMQQTLVLLWKKGKKYVSVSYSFRCISKSESSNEKLRKSHFYTESFQSSSTIRGSGFSYKFKIIKTSNNSFFTAN